MNAFTAQSIALSFFMMLGACATPTTNRPTTNPPTTNPPAKPTAESTAHPLKKTQNAPQPIYPPSALSRYYRWEMFQALKRSLQRPRLAHLQAYSFWYYRWSKNFRAEAKSPLDHAPQLVADFLPSLLYGKKQRRILKKKGRRRILNQQMPHYSPQEAFSLAYESQMLVPLAVIILEERKIPPLSDRSQPMDSPLALLARLQPAKNQPIDHNEQNRWVLGSVTKMRVMDPQGKMDRAIKDLATPGKLRVVFEREESRDSTKNPQLRYRSFFNFRGLQGVELGWDSADAWSSLQKDRALFEKGAPLIMAERTPCDFKGKSRVMTFDGSQVSRDKKTLTLPGGHLQRDGFFIEAGAQQWFCVPLGTKLQRR